MMKQLFQCIRSQKRRVVEAALKHFAAPLHSLHAWLGPAIGPNNFVVGDDVKVAMEHLNPIHLQSFKAYKDRWLLDLLTLVRNELNQLGVQHVTSSNLCTVENSDNFFSYRRDGVTGRMASLLWIAA